MSLYHSLTPQRKCSKEEIEKRTLNLRLKMIESGLISLGVKKTVARRLLKEAKMTERWNYESYFR